MTGALTPTAPGPWMCPAVAGAEIPEKLPLKVKFVPDNVRLTVPLPCRAPPPSWAPVKLAMKLWAEALARLAAIEITVTNVFISCLESGLFIKIEPHGNKSKWVHEFA